MTSGDPLAYLGSTLQLIGLPILVLGAHLDRKQNAYPISLADALFCIPFFLILFCGILTWLFLIAPAQYFVNYVCRIPSLLVANSTVTVYARLRDGWKLEITTQRDKEEVQFDSTNLWWDASMRGNGQRLTNAYAAILLTSLAWILSAIGGV
jgi:hypothetical protein